MDRAKFIVLDFVIQPHPDGFSAAKGRKIDKRHLQWEQLVDRIKGRVKSQLIGAALGNDSGKLDAQCETVGAVDEDHATMASFILQQPTRQHILRVEDYLRQHVVTTEGGDIPADAQPNITVKVKDHNGRFLNFQVTDFTLSGPSKGNWKPFTEWYGALKTLGLLSNPREGITKHD